MRGAEDGRSGTLELDGPLHVMSNDEEQVVSEWRVKPLGVHRYALTAVLHEDEGGFVVEVAQLPGVVTEADTAEEAVRNVTEAACGAIESYRELGEAIPWASPEESAEVLDSAYKCLAFTVELHG